MTQISEQLKALLFSIRQHPGKADLIRYLDPPPMPRYKKGESLEEHGARSVYTSGMRDQHDRLGALLTGRASQEEKSE